MACIPYFTGIDAPLRVRLTYNAHGIAPSVATLDVPPQQLKTKYGQLGLVDTVSGEAVWFNDCLVNSYRYQGIQPTVMSLQILDERWKWKHHTISGAYNVKRKDGTVRPATEKTPRELATLLLDAMQVQSYEVSNLPSDARPEKLWDYTNAAQELERLCNDLGCRVVRELTGKVVIHRKGVGAALPAGANLQPDASIDPADKPEAIRFVCGRDMHQKKLSFKPVCEDEPGKYVELEDSALKPAGGWENEDPQYFFGVTHQSPAPTDKPTDRELAQRSVWRAYRLDYDQTISIDGKSYTIEEILPLFDQQIDVSTADKETQEKIPARAIGSYWNGNPALENTEDDNTINVEYELKADIGVIIFKDPVFKYASGTTIEASEVQLDCVFQLTDSDTGMKQRKSYDFPLQGAVPGAGEEVVKLFDVVYKRKEDGTDNEQDVLDEVEYYARPKIESYDQVDTAGSVTFSGIHGIRPDGALQQITWSGGGDAAAITQISRNKELEAYVPDYNSRQKKFIPDQDQQQVIDNQKAEQHNDQRS